MKTICTHLILLSVGLFQFSRGSDEFITKKQRKNQEVEFSSTTSTYELWQDGQHFPSFSSERPPRAQPRSQIDHTGSRYENFHLDFTKGVVIDNLLGWEQNASKVRPATSSTAAAVPVVSETVAEEQHHPVKNLNDFDALKGFVGRYDSPPRKTAAESSSNVAASGVNTPDSYRLSNTINTPNSAISEQSVSEIYRKAPVPKSYSIGPLSDEVFDWESGFMDDHVKASKGSGGNYESDYDFSDTD